MPAAENDIARGTRALSTVAGCVLLLTLVADLNGGDIQVIDFTHPGLDKLAHFGMHATLVGLLFTILRRYWPLHSAGFALGIAAGISTLTGLLDEGHQYFVGSRDFDLLDIAANLCGTATAAALLAAVLIRSTRAPIGPDFRRRHRVPLQYTARVLPNEAE